VAAAELSTDSPSRQLRTAAREEARAAVPARPRAVNISAASEHQEARLPLNGQKHPAAEIGNIGSLERIDLRVICRFGR